MKKKARSVAVIAVVSILALLCGSCGRPTWHLGKWVSASPSEVDRGAQIEIYPKAITFSEGTFVVETDYLGETYTTEYAVSESSKTKSGALIIAGECKEAPPGRFGLTFMMICLKKEGDRLALVKPGGPHTPTIVDHEWRIRLPTTGCRRRGQAARLSRNVGFLNIGSTYKQQPHYRETSGTNHPSQEALPQGIRRKVCCQPGTLDRMQAFQGG